MFCHVEFSLQQCFVSDNSSNFAGQSSILSTHCSGTQQRKYDNKLHNKVNSWYIMVQRKTMSDISQKQQRQNVGRIPHFSKDPYWWAERCYLGVIWRMMTVRYHECTLLTFHVVLPPKLPSPDHQQAWYWCKIGTSVSSLKVDFKTMCLSNINNDMKYKCIFVFLKKEIQFNMWRANT